MTELQTGVTYSGFRLNHVQTIPEIDSTVYHFTHALLQTPAFAIKNNDPI